MTPIIPFQPLITLDSTKIIFGNIGHKFGAKMLQNKAPNAPEHLKPQSFQGP